MLCRIWRGWTTPANAAAYELVVRNSVIPAIESRAIDGFLSIDLVRRNLEEEVEFCTIMWFTSLQAVVAFVGENATVAHVPAPARAVLSRFDERARHYEVLDRRDQRPGPGAASWTSEAAGSSNIAAAEASAAAHHVKRPASPSARPGGSRR